MSRSKFGSVYYCFIVDEFESELAIMDLLLATLDLLDRVFKRCREVDIKLNPEKVSVLIDQMISNGIVISTNVDEIIENYNELTAKPSILPLGLNMASLTGWTSYFSKK